MSDVDSEQEGDGSEYRHLVQSGGEDEESSRPRRDTRKPYFALTCKNVILVGCGGLVLCFVAALLAFLSGSSGFVLVDVTVDCGVVRGYHSNIAYTFKGIPYALPPVGSLRWKPPVELKSSGSCWNGTYDATSFKHICAQVQPLDASGTVLGEEDCLYLNVWTPSLQKEAKLPVMVWIHGGYLHMLSGSQKGYAPSEELAKETNAVYVSFNYRLNAFGFMALEVLRQNSPKNTSGNYGFLDQIEVLHWVKNNIQVFGGDPEKVTIFGQSSGGTSVWTLMMSPLAKGLFHRAIDMSGSYVYNKSLEEAEKDNLLFMNKTGCGDLRCLYSLSKEKILRSIPWSEYPYWAAEDLCDLPVKGHFDGAVAVVDRYVLPAPPMEMWEKNISGFNDIPLLVGTMQQEADFSPPKSNISSWTKTDYEWYVKVHLDPFGEDITQTALSLYPSTETCSIGKRCLEKTFTTLVSDMRLTCPKNKMASQAAKALKSPVYRYVATYVPSRPLKTSELMPFPARFAFHILDSCGFFKTLEYILGGTSVKDRNFSRLLQKYFLHFAINGKLHRGRRGHAGAVKLYLPLSLFNDASRGLAVNNSAFFSGPSSVY
uniref:Carboxylic ester hydrolase n=1 Tax=Latimeria chalumnae TaxID=7897 RepID=H3BI85_LATCH|nr:PREDICTED: para-nitrobenzyl esterase-like isoform X1 [Latimeria chalumnae]XP_014343873.1 PREDICTED: para-nitrobenzyl esterase-like isoform X1 [Latimeria chalumnae]|eukprot:XP_005987005.1 PREDICTED: para-nitrobenzyl esterase-like isoform X1 [Latimeria chalumnae]